MENVSCFGHYEVNIWLKRHIWLWYSSTICSKSIIIIKLLALNCVNPQSTCINLDWYGHINYNSVETKNVFIHEFYRCNFLIISFFSFFALLFIFFFSHRCKHFSFFCHLYFIPKVSSKSFNFISTDSFSKCWPQHFASGNVCALFSMSIKMKKK